VNIYEKHRENIEKIINEELIKLQNLNIWTWKIYLYRVSSEFDWEIQIKLSNL
jgi:hypothetical protein